MFFACKRCGAQSPTGIGYAANDQTAFPDPRPGCPNDHADGAERLAALVISEQEFVTNALWSFARHMDEWETKAVTGEAGPLVDSVGAQRAAAMFAENANKARRVAREIDAFAEKVTGRAAADDNEDEDA